MKTRFLAIILICLISQIALSGDPPHSSAIVRSWMKDEFVPPYSAKAYLEFIKWSKAAKWYEGYVYKGYKVKCTYKCESISSYTNNWVFYMEENITSNTFKIVKVTDSYGYVIWPLRNVGIDWFTSEYVSSEKKKSLAILKSFRKYFQLENGEPRKPKRLRRKKSGKSKGTK